MTETAKAVLLARKHELQGLIDHIQRTINVIDFQLEQGRDNEG